MNTALLKQSLRKEFIARRDLLPETEKFQREQLAISNLRRVLPPLPATVHLFLSAKGKSEFDTWRLSDELKTEGYTLCIPYISGKGNMVSVNYKGKESLVQKKFGLFEPEVPEITDPASIQMIIVPLLAFDNMGYRLGYGGGYYDNYLKDFSHIPKVGLSLFPAEGELLPRHSWDIPLDSVASPVGLIEFL